MLKRRTCLISLLLIIVAFIGSAATVTSAEAAPAGCKKHSRFVGSCSLKVKVPGKGGGEANSNVAAPVKSGGSGKRTCTYHDKPIACSGSDGNWYAPKNCYAKPAGAEITDVAAAQPGFSLYTCRGPGNPVPIDLALPNAGLGAPAPPPDPAVLAQQAIAQMGLHAIEIGIVPKPGHNSVGLVGMPTWMWVADPGESTTGPITRTASKAGYTVTATASVRRIVWRMGDGHSVVCEGEGTPYEDSYGKRSSPTCGHTYSKQGRYTVTATSYWQVVWGGIGQTGVINLNFAADAAINVGEAQVIVR